MATIRQGTQGALVVVDVQVGVVRAAWEAGRVIRNVALAVEKARARGLPVIWVQHSDDELVRGSPEWQWVPELVPAHDEALFHKQFNSAFEDTALESRLEALGVSHIVLAGAATNWCIRATAYAALDRGYDLTLLEDAHTTETMALDDGSKIEAADSVRDLNLTLKWVSYPGRRNATAKTAEVDLAALGGSPPSALP